MPISLHPKDQQGLPCCHTCLTVTSSYHSKVNLVGLLDAEKLAEAGFLNVFNIGFPASLLLYSDVQNSIVLLVLELYSTVE